MLIRTVSIWLDTEWNLLQEPLGKGTPKAQLWVTNLLKKNFSRASFKIIWFYCKKKRRWFMRTSSYLSKRFQKLIWTYKTWKGSSTTWCSSIPISKWILWLTQRAKLSLKFKTSLSNVLSYWIRKILSKLTSKRLNDKALCAACSSVVWMTSLWWLLMSIRFKMEAIGLRESNTSLVKSNHLSVKKWWALRKLNLMRKPK